MKGIYKNFTLASNLLAMEPPQKNHVLEGTLIFLGIHRGALSCQSGFLEVLISLSVSLPKNQPLKINYLCSY